MNIKIRENKNRRYAEPSKKMMTSIFLLFAIAIIGIQLSLNIPLTTIFIGTTCAGLMIIGNYSIWKFLFFEIIPAIVTAVGQMIGLPVKLYFGRFVTITPLIEGSSMWKLLLLDLLFFFCGLIMIPIAITIWTTVTLGLWGYVLDPVEFKNLLQEFFAML